MQCLLLPRGPSGEAQRHKRHLTQSVSPVGPDQGKGPAHVRFVYAVLCESWLERWLRIACICILSLCLLQLESVLGKHLCFNSPLSPWFLTEERWEGGRWRENHQMPLL